VSKKFKGKTCVYCASNPSTTADHVFAREFLPVRERDSLPKVPACDACNRTKSTHEHYLTSVLPFGGRHADAKDNLTAMVPPRLKKNQKLHKELSESQTNVLIREGGLLVPTTAIAVDGVRVLNLCEYITKGLLFHHFGVILDAAHDVRALSITEAGEALFVKLKGQNAAERIEGNLGNGALVYDGAQGVDDAQFSVWRLQLLGGLTMSGDSDVGSSLLSNILGITATQSFFEGKFFKEAFNS
jgi:hypothetical protein